LRKRNSIERKIMITKIIKLYIEPKTMRHFIELGFEPETRAHSAFQKQWNGVGFEPKTRAHSAFQSKKKTSGKMLQAGIEP